MRRTSLTIRLLSLAAGLLLSLAAIAADHGVIKIGTTASQTGEYARLGTDQLQGLMMWEADLNSRGALLGNRVEVVAYDDGSDPQRAAEIYERMITEEGVDFLIGPYSSDITLAVAEVAERHQIPMVAAGAAAIGATGKGHLAAGNAADLVAVKGDLFSDVRSVTNVEHVWLRGQPIR